MGFKWLYVLLSSLFFLASPHLESLDGTHLSVQKERREGYFAMVIRGTGMYTFVHEFGSKDENYSIRTLQIINDNFVLDGTVLDQTTRTYHPYFMVITNEGEILIHEIFTSPSQQDLSGVYPLLEGYLIHITQMDESTEIFEQDYLYIFDETLITKESFSDEILDIIATDQGYHVRFKYENSPRIFITLEREFLSGNELKGVLNKESYTGEITLLFAGEATLNQLTIQAPYEVSSPGHYTFILNQTYTRFTLHPFVSGVEAGRIYTQPVQIEYEYGQAFINNEPYASREVIDQPGHYVFGFYQGDYIYEIPFTLTANVRGIKHLESYDSAVNVSFLGEGYINNQYFHSGASLSDPGRYTLKVFGSNGYLETHTFEIIDLNEKAFQMEWVELGLLGGSAVLGAGLIIDSAVRRFKKKRP